MDVLAVFEEPRAYPLLIEYLRAGSRAAAKQLGDILTEDVPAIVARTYEGGDLARLKSVLTDATAEPFVRSALFQSLHAMAVAGKVE